MNTEKKVIEQAPKVKVRTQQDQYQDLIAQNEVAS
jgi:hypothetical protein